MNARNSKSFPRRGPILSAPIRADVRLSNAEGFTKFFRTWDDVHTWMASPGFAMSSAGITSIRLIHQAAQAGGAQ